MKVKKICTFLSLILTLGLFTGCSQEVSTNKVEVKGAFESSAPKDQNMDPMKLKAMTSALRNFYPALRSTIIIRNNKVVYEEYFKGDNIRDELHDIQSCTKTVTAILTGIAIDKGIIKGEDQKVSELLPKYINESSDERSKSLTVEHLLSGKLGKKWNEMGHPGTNDQLIAEWEREDTIKYFIDKPFDSNPGEKFTYSSMGPHMISQIISDKTGKSEAKFAEENLFKPLGITKYEWPDKNGVSIGGHGLKITPTDMAKIGVLILNKGKWEGKQIVSEQWITKMTTRNSDGGMPTEEGYGYLTWLGTSHLLDVQMASGLGGQYIFVIPKLNMVAVATSNPEIGEEVKSILDSMILPSANDVPRIPVGDM